MRTTAVLPLLGSTGCGLFSDDPAGLAQVDTLTGWIERVHVDSELSRDRANDATDVLRALVESNFAGDAASTHQELVAAIERSEGQANRLRSSSESMRESAEPVFEQWSQDLLAFSSPRMRQRSQMRLDQTRRRYEAIVAAVGPEQTSLDAVNVSLRDIALFLGNDFNAMSVAEIREDLHAVEDLIAELDGRVETCLTACREYVDATAMPDPVEGMDAGGGSFRDPAVDIDSARPDRGGRGNG